jgi:hypothetical protein
MYDVFIEYDEEWDLEHEVMIGIIECGNEKGLLLSHLASSMGKLEKGKVNDQSIGILL